MPVTESPVLVTGVTGFVAAEIVKQLLADGYRVRGTTRDVEGARRHGELTSLEGADERLELVAADLKNPGAFTEPMAGCEYVIHVASPYTLEVEDPQRDLVDPAVNGTISILESAVATPTVKRIVITSSFAAISSGPRDEPYDESDWNNTSTLERGPYAFSKTMAERAAWDFMESSDRHFGLVVINPTGVIGPSVVDRVNQTHEFMIGITNGQSPAIIDISFAVVDVGDVARAHIKAMEIPSASGRYLVSAGAPKFRRYVEIMEEEGLGEKYKLPRLGLDNAFGSVLVRGLMLFQPKLIRDFVISNLGRTPNLDTSKAESELGMRWSNVEDSLREQARFLDEKGYLGKK